MNTASGNQSPTRKETAISFLTLVASGHVREPYRKYIAPDFRHHNPYYRGDAASLMQGMEQNAREFPRKILEVQRAQEDGDLVAVLPRAPAAGRPRHRAGAHLPFPGRCRRRTVGHGPARAGTFPNENGMF